MDKKQKQKQEAREVDDEKKRLARINRVKIRLLASMMDELKTGEITALELLGVLSHTVGQCLAMQDSRLFTSEQLFEMVTNNIQQGNIEAVDAFIKSQQPPEPSEKKGGVPPGTKIH